VARLVFAFITLSVAGASIVAPVRLRAAAVDSGGLCVIDCNTARGKHWERAETVEKKRSIGSVFWETQERKQKVTDCRIEEQERNALALIRNLRYECGKDG